MNSWFNILCIMMILCAQDYFGVGPVIAGEYDNLHLNKSERGTVHNEFTHLYHYVKNELNEDGVKIERFETWANDEDIKNVATGEEELHHAKPFIDWAMIGANLIITAYKKPQGKKFYARIGEAVNNIDQHVNKDNADIFVDILDDLQYFLSTGTNTPLPGGYKDLFLSKSERETVHNVVTNLYQYVKNELEKDGFKIDLKAWEDDEDIRNDVTGEGELHFAKPILDWTLKGAKLIITAYKKPQGKKFYAQIDEAKKKILEKVYKNEATYINEILDYLQKFLSTGTNAPLPEILEDLQHFLSKGTNTP